MNRKPTILFIAILDEGVIHYSAGGFGGEFIFDVLPHKQAFQQLTGWLRQNECEGHYVWVDIGEAYTEKGLSKIVYEIAKHKPDALGFSLCTLEVPTHYRLIDFLKAIYPDIPVIAGGTHVSALPEHTLQNYPLIDYVAIGEGEVTLTEWLKLIASGAGKGEMHNIKGLAFRDDTGNIIRTQPRERIDDLNTLPEPACDLVCNDAAPGKPNSAFAILCSYGCPFNCTFCSVEHGHYRYLDPVRVVDRIEWAQKKYGVEYFGIRDSLWPPNARWLDTFCGEIEKRRLKIQFHFLTRVGILDEKQLVRLKRIGARAIAMGVEAGHPDILKSIKKGITYENARESFALLHKVGIFSIAFFMFGNQGEDRNTIQASVDMATELNPTKAYFNVLNPFPGSVAFDYVTAGEKDWWMQRRTIPTISHLSPDELQHLSREALTRHPLRWRYFIQHIIGGRMPLNVRRIAWKIFITNLRSYVLGISERFWLTRKMIHGLKAVLAR